MYIVFNQATGQIVSGIIETTYEAECFVKFFENLYLEYQNKNVIVVYELMREM